MPDRPSLGAVGPSDRSYGLGSLPAEQQRLETRTATDRARSLIPHLRAGMHLLDVGCGPGTITIGLAQLVAPGHVVGVDIQAAQVERATLLAAKQGVPQVRFEVGDAYSLAFPDDSFDAVFANTLLSHLHEPIRALREMHRVLRPGGVACVADIDADGIVVSPPIPDVAAGLLLFQRIRAHRRGRDADVHLLRGHLLAAGFRDVIGDAFLQVAGTAEQTRQTAHSFTTLLNAPADLALAVDHQWTDAAELSRIVAAWHDWSERPDAFYYQATVAAVGWKGERAPKPRQRAKETSAG